MVKLKYFLLFTLIAMLVVSPVFAQDSAQITDGADVILTGVIARGNSFASILEVYTPDEFFSVVWGDDGRVLYQTPSGERIIGVDPSGETLIIQREGVLLLGGITAQSYHELKDYGTPTANFSVRFTDVGTFFVLAVYRLAEDLWDYSLTEYSVEGDELGEWRVPGGYSFIESYSHNGRFVVLQYMPEGGAQIGIDLDEGRLFEVGSDFDDPMDLQLERVHTIEGSTTSIRACVIDIATGECFPGTVYESSEPTTFTESAYIYRPIRVPGTNLLAGFGWAGLGYRTFLVVDNGPEWSVLAWWEEPPSESLFYMSDLPTFAANQQEELVLVWGNWASGYIVGRATLTDAVQGQIPVEDVTGMLYPTYEQILEALPQQG